MSILNPQYSEILETSDDGPMLQLFDHIDYVIKHILNNIVQPELNIPRGKQGNAKRYLKIGQREAARTFNIERKAYEPGQRQHESS
mgnify:CR=1 FL=1